MSLCCSPLPPPSPSPHESRASAAARLRRGPLPTAVLAAAVAVACALSALVVAPVGAAPMSSAASLPPLPRHPNMFEISTRPWLFALSQKYGRNLTRLADIPDAELQALAAKGIDMVWFMGVWHLGAYGLHFDRTNPDLLKGYAQTLPGFTTDDIIGSPYAVTEYSCNPELGSDDDISALRKRMNAMGLRLMVDFVPNHSAVDAVSVTSNPDYYVHAAKGTQPPYDPNAYYTNGMAYGSDGWGQWRDTLQYNYWNSDTVKFRISELMKVASLADGIRCDMAMLMLNDRIQQIWGTQLASWGYMRPSSEFWATAIKQVKAEFPGTIFLAETYQPYNSALMALGFDFCYDKSLYDNVGSGNLDSVRGYITGNTADFFEHSAHFVSNHDEPRAAAFFGSWWRADAAALIMFTMPGMKFHWQWQWNGFVNRLDVHLRRETAEPVVADVQAFYDRLLNITTSPVFNNGDWTYLNVGNSDTAWRLVAWKWTNGTDKRLVVVNFSDTNGSGSIVLDDAQAVHGNDTIPVTDLLSGETYYRSASAMRTSGLFVVVNSWYGQIFEY